MMLDMPVPLRGTIPDLIFDPTLSFDRSQVNTLKTRNYLRDIEQN